MTRCGKAGIAIAILVLCCLAPYSLFAGYTGLTELQPGFYLSKLGANQDSLVIDRVTNEGFHLVLYNEPSLAKKCLIEGLAVFEKASKYEAKLNWNVGEGKSCHYRLHVAPAGISVLSFKTDQPECHNVCEKTLFATERSFAYQYPGCSPRQMATRHDDYKRLYDGKKFGEAYEVLNYTYDHCMAYVDPDGEAWLYSDLALAALKKGDAKKCLEVLDEYDGIRTAPNGKVAKALELNKQLCTGASPG